MIKRLYYPFSAIVGQARIKEALLLNAVNPRIGGTLMRGEKGSVKSTAVRALINLLGTMRVVKGCSYLCDPEKPAYFCFECSTKSIHGELTTVEVPIPFCNFPLSATEDMVLGGIDFEKAIKTGKKECRPGLLASVNRGILYIDEVNLLNDYLADMILDVSISGVNIIEREGVSSSHTSNFILIGTMNPEEGEIRPQLLDRFGLSVKVESELDPYDRITIMKRREEFDSDPLEFIFQYKDREQELRERIIRAQKLLQKIRLSEANLRNIAEIAKQSSCVGHRAEIFMGRAAKTIASMDDRINVSDNDIIKSAEYVLPHRMRKSDDALEDISDCSSDRKDQSEDKSETILDKERKKLPNSGHPNDGKNSPSDNEKQAEENSQGEVRYNPENNFIFNVGEIFESKTIRARKDRISRKGSGRRSRTKTEQKVGRYIKSSYRNNGADIALDATIRAASVFQKTRKGIYQNNSLNIIIEKEDLRGKSREKKVGNYTLFVVDASGSMGAKQRMIETKGAIMSLLLDAYQKRDRVGMIAFRGDMAECILPPTSSVELAGKLLKDIPVGGRTPLSHAIATTYRILQSSFIKDKTIQPIVVFVTDGKANVSYQGGKAYSESIKFARSLYEKMPVKYVVIDTEPDHIIQLGLAKSLAASLNAEYYKPEELRSDNIAEITKGVL